MKFLAKASIGLSVLGLGVFLTLLGFTRMGWRRQGASWTDLSFFHVDWIFQPKLPYWSAHPQNFLFAFVDFVLILGSFLLLFKERTSGEKPSS